MNATITEHHTDLSRGGIFHLAAGPPDGPPIIFLHGWPELALSYRHQLPVFGGLGGGGAQAIANARELARRV